MKLSPLKLICALLLVSAFCAFLVSADEAEMKAKSHIESKKLKMISSLVQDALDKVEEAISNESGCPRGCSGRGECLTANKTCHCNDGWTGKDCSASDQPIASGQILDHQRVGGGRWAYYYIDVVGGNASLSWTVNTSSVGDCDLYLLRNGYPNLTNYDMIDISLDNELEMTVAGPEDGRWRLGVYGFGECKFSIGAELTSAANSSGNGTSGNFTVLVPNQPVVGVVYTNSWVYFAVNVSSNGTHHNHSHVVSLSTFSVHNSTSSSDVDLYLGAGFAPTLYNFTEADFSIAANSSLSLNSSEGSLWIVGVYGFQCRPYCAFSLVFQNSTNSTNSTSTSPSNSTLSCVNNCTGRGQCQAVSTLINNSTSNGTTAVCACRYPFAGNYCQIALGPLADSQISTGSAEPGLWNYYVYAAYSEGSNTTATIWVNQTQPSRGNGDCDVYVKGDDFPSLNDWDYGNFGMSPDSEVQITAPLYHAWYIGVYGYAACTYRISVSTLSDGGF